MFLRQVAAQSLIFLLIGIIVYVLTRLLRFQHRAWSFGDARSSSLWALTGILVGWLAVSLLFFVVVGSRGGPPTTSDERVYSVGHVLGQAMVALIAFGPVLVVMRWRREPWASAGVSRHNLGRALVVGLFLALLTMTQTPFVGIKCGLVEAYSHLSVSHLWAFFTYTIVGFSEEFAFRGYLQTRMVAWLGQ